MTGSYLVWAATESAGVVTIGGDYNGERESTEAWSGSDPICRLGLRGNHLAVFHHFRPHILKCYQYLVLEFRFRWITSIVAGACGDVLQLAELIVDGHSFCVLDHIVV